MRIVFESHAPDETLSLARALGLVAREGLLIGLAGRLGAGKTLFVRGLAEGLDIDDPRSVASPTYVLIHEYHARLPIYHFDSYRLSNESAFAELGIEEYFDGDGVSVVEWSDRVASVLPADRIDVRIDDMINGESYRQIEATLQGRRWTDLVLAWYQATMSASDFANAIDRLRLLEE
jgi:tRNA threonylcarbamoyladenosine biosynthesis protein TsaE